jgi:histidinol phosphatase-like PHP family hydrolase
MKSIVDTLAKNGIAMELNNRRRLPIGAFIDLAKHAGVTFTCGTNNAGASDLGRNEFCAEMITAHGLGPQHFWTPPSDGAKAVQRPPLLKQPARARRYALR